MNAANFPGPDLFPDDFWPAEKPDVPVFDHGWLREGTKEILRRYATRAKVILELGVWLGKSTRFLTEIAPDAVVISVDSWNTRALRKWAKQKAPHLLEVSSHPMETFLVNCWDLKQRVIPVRQTSTRAIPACARAGIKPDLIYLDTGHTYAQTLRELQAIQRHLPGAQIVGDDWDWRPEERHPLQRAVREFCRANGYGIYATSTGWAVLKPGAKGFAPA